MVAVGDNLTAAKEGRSSARILNRTFRPTSFARTSCRYPFRLTLGLGLGLDVKKGVVEDRRISESGLGFLISTHTISSLQGRATAYIQDDADRRLRM